MGMTIDDCIKELLINKEDDTYVLGNETIDFSIDTMRKYQKIQEIVEKWSEDEIDYEGHYGDDYMEKIQEVLEDGNDD